MSVSDRVFTVWDVEHELQVTADNGQVYLSFIVNESNRKEYLMRLDLDDARALARAIYERARWCDWQEERSARKEQVAP
jgi:hypothetical protein